MKWKEYGRGLANTFHGPSAPCPALFLHVQDSHGQSRVVTVQKDDGPGGNFDNWATPEACLRKSVKLFMWLIRLGDIMCRKQPSWQHEGVQEKIVFGIMFHSGKHLEFLCILKFQCFGLNSTHVQRCTKRWTCFVKQQPCRARQKFLAT